jgi:phage-related minor tail protein
MSKRIQGITIELDGETTGLKKALADVDRTARNLAGELREVDRALKLDPGNMELAAQKQRILADQVQATSTRLERLRSVYAQVEAQAKSGQIGEEQFRAFQREIITTESRLKGLQTQINKLDDSKAPDQLKTDMNQVEKEAEEASSGMQSLSESIENMGEGLGYLQAVGDQLKDIATTALETSSLDTQIDINFDVPESSRKSVKDAIKQIEAYGVDGQTALEGVRRQWALNKDASDASNTAIVKGAATIAASYSGLDFTQVIQQINGIAGELNISNEAALGLTSALLKAGFPPENIDQITEYGAQLSRAGYTAEEIQAIFAAGIDTKSWNIDNLMDGLKEGRIRMAEFGQEVPKAMQDLLKGTDISTKQLQTWGKQIAQGGAGGKKAMQDVATALKGVDDSTKQNALGVQIFGTMWEDQGANILDTLTNANSETVDLSANQKQLNADVQQMDSDPAVQWAKAIADLKTALTPVLEVVSQFIAKIAEWISNNPVFAATIAAIVAVLGILFGIIAGGITIVAAIMAAIVVFGTTVMGTVALIAAGIAALIAIGVLLYTNWETIIAWLSAAWTGLKEIAIAAWEGIKSGISTALDATKAFILSTWEAIKSGVNSAINGLKNIIESIWNGIKNTTTTIWNAVKDFVVGAFQWLYNHNYYFKDLVDAIVAAWNWLKSTTTSVWNSVKSWLTSAWNSIKTTATNTWNSIKSSVSSIWNSIKSSIMSVVNPIISFLSSAWNSIKSNISSAMNAVKSAITNGFNSAKSTVSSVVNSITSTLSGIASRARSWGSNLLSMFISGVKSKISALVGVLKEAAGKVASLLGFHSPTKEGPASDSDTWAPNFMRMFGEGIEKGLPDLSRITSRVAEQLQESVASVNTNHMAREALQPIVQVTPSLGNVNIVPAPIVLDGKQIAKATFGYTTELQNQAQRLHFRGKGR